MEVSCAQCNTKLNVPDEKIPKDQMIRINCPKCKNKGKFEVIAVRTWIDIPIKYGLAFWK